MNTVLQIPAPNLNASLDFYKKLEFYEFKVDNNIYVTDGKLIIHINPRPKARLAVNLYHNNWVGIVRELKNVVPIIKTDEGFTLFDPSGVRINLINGFSQTNKQMHDVEVKTVLGHYSGLTIECIEIRQNLLVWEVLGFTKLAGDVESDWVSYVGANDFCIHFMAPNQCPHALYNPSLTYFNGQDNVKVIQKIRDLGINIMEEVTIFNEDGDVDNIVVQDPSGLTYLIFND